MKGKKKVITVEEYDKLNDTIAELRELLDKRSESTSAFREMYREVAEKHKVLLGGMEQMQGMVNKLKERLKLVDVRQILQDLYDSEIHFEINVTWDQGVEVYLHDGSCKQNLLRADDKFTCSEDHGENIKEAIQKLVDMAIKFYPNSVFAVKYRKKTIEEPQQEDLKLEA